MVGDEGGTIMEGCENLANSAVTAAKIDVAVASQKALGYHITANRFGSDARMRGILAFRIRAKPQSNLSEVDTESINQRWLIDLVPASDGLSRELTRMQNPRTTRIFASEPNMVAVLTPSTCFRPTSLLFLLACILTDLSIPDRE